MNLPEPKSVPYSSLISDIKKGLIKIPQFQRDFVWSKEKSAALIDSIVKGYPIGAFITWKTKEKLRVVRNLGDIDLPDVPDGDFANYVLDGQQRMTSLFSALNGVSIQREKKIDNFADIFIDLNADEHQKIVVTDVGGLAQDSYLRLTELIHGDFTFLAGFPSQFHDKLKEYKQKLEGYSFSIIEVKDAPIDVATEIFTRINVGGKPLSVFEIMVAKTFDADKDFDLAEKFDGLVNDLAEVGYSTISDATVLQTVSLVISQECKKQDILRLDKQRFIEEWPKVVDAIESAVDYFRGYYRIPVSRLLPYNTLLAPFAYFFYHHKDKPTGDKQKYLEDFFWRSSLGGRYSSAVESKLAQDIKRIDIILDNKLPKYDYSIDSSAEFIKDNGWFGTGRSYIKALLCIMAYHQPKSFIDGAIVHISNDWLKQANSRNYHHFFPRAFLKKQGEDGFFINHIANITIVDDFLNKKKIRAKAPSVYMAEFEKVNPDLSKDMKTHLIGTKGWGISDDDYDTFFGKRCEALSKEVSKRIIDQSADALHRQTVNFEDLEPSELEV